MITREQAQTLLLNSLRKEAEKKGMDTPALMSPCKGKCSWTYRELIEKVEKDEPLENGSNQIDTLLNFEKHLNAQGRSLLVDEY